MHSDRGSEDVDTPKKCMYLLQIEKKSRSPFIACERVTKRVVNAKIEIYKTAFSVLTLW